MIRIAKQMAYLGITTTPGHLPQWVCALLPVTGHAGQARPVTTAATPAAACVHGVGNHHRYLARRCGDYWLGAAASVLAHTLVARGRDVLMLERGDYVERSQMTDDEVEMLSRLYADGALQPHARL